MEEDKVLSVILLSGEHVEGIKFTQSDTIKDLKDKISEYNTSGVDFKIVYCGRTLTNESDLFSCYYRNGQTKLYLLTAGVKGSCCGKTDC